MKKLLFTLLATLCLMPISAQEAGPWEKGVYATAADILDTYSGSRSRTNSLPAAIVFNDCCMIWAAGEYVLACRGEKPDIAQLLDALPEIEPDDPTVTEFIRSRDPAAFADRWFMLRAMKNGLAFDKARDGLSIYTRFPNRAPNRNDYAKLAEVFGGANSLLHKAYLEKLKFVFRNYGLTDGLMEVLPLIETRVARSPLRDEVLKFYARYAPLRQGQPAPLPILYDAEGHEYTFAKFHGKVVVVDVWATWCCSCIEKMPAFMELRDEFAGQDVVFLTVSIDRPSTRAKWAEALDKYGMEGMTNLITTDGSKRSTFEDDYAVSGVSRYFILDREGKIVSVFAPGPVNEMKEMIITELK